MSVCVSHEGQLHGNSSMYDVTSTGLTMGRAGVARWVEFGGGGSPHIAAGLINIDT